MLEIAVLGSGSSGNCALVMSRGYRILVDAGLSARQIALRLELLGVDPGSLDGIVLTHEHGDHVAGLDVFCKRFPVPVVCTARTREMLVRNLRPGKEWRVLPVEQEVVLGDLEVLAFPVPHDAVEPVGLTIRSGGVTFGVVSDVGHVTGKMLERLGGAHALFVEANYDAGLLEQDTRRPWSTKQRIAAAHGHLSNHQTAELVRGVASDRLRRVILGHLSEDCNDPQVATAAVASALGQAGAGHVEVSCAPRREPTELFRFSAEEAVAGPGARSTVPL